MPGPARGQRRTIERSPAAWAAPWPALRLQQSGRPSPCPRREVMHGEGRRARQRAGKSRTAPTSRRTRRRDDPRPHRGAAEQRVRTLARPREQMREAREGNARPARAVKSRNVQANVGSKMVTGKPAQLRCTLVPARETMRAAVARGTLPQRDASNEQGASARRGGEAGFGSSQHSTGKRESRARSRESL